jgi:hypothetical protein
MGAISKLSLGSRLDGRRKGAVGTLVQGPPPVGNADPPGCWATFLPHAGRVHLERLRELYVGAASCARDRSRSHAAQYETGKTNEVNEQPAPDNAVGAPGSAVDAPGRRRLVDAGGKRSRRWRIGPAVAEMAAEVALPPGGRVGASSPDGGPRLWRSPTRPAWPRGAGSTRCLPRPAPTSGSTCEGPGAPAWPVLDPSDVHARSTRRARASGHPWARRGRGDPMGSIDDPTVAQSHSDHAR